MSGTKFSELDKKGVISSDGREIGEVADFIVDPEAWSVTALMVKLDRDLLEQFHMKRPMFGTQTIQLPTRYVSGVGDKVLLTKKLDELTAMARERAAAVAPAADDDAT